MNDNVNETRKDKVKDNLDNFAKKDESKHNAVYVYNSIRGIVEEISKSNRTNEMILNSNRITRSDILNTIDKMISISDNEDFIREIDKIAYETLFTGFDMLWMRVQRLKQMCNIYYPTQYEGSIGECIHFILNKGIDGKWKEKED